MSWTTQLRPTPLSRAYRVRLHYRDGKAPETFIDDPHLPSLAPERALPHVYSERPTKLCLYLPGTGEWTPHLYLADTILPWTLLWLYYFELWLRTDEWHGGGEHPR